MDQRTQLDELLDTLNTGTLAILCIGNVLKGDDGAGPLLAENISQEVAAEVIDAGTVPENYIGKISDLDPDLLLFVDAVDFGGRPGQIRVFQPQQLESGSISTHSLPPQTLLTIICARTSARVRLLGIQPLHFGFADPVSYEVAAAVEFLARRMMRALARRD